MVKHIERPTPLEEAAEIMDINMIGPGFILSCFRLVTGELPSGILVDPVPFMTDTLLECCDTHLLIPVAPVSIRQMIERGHERHFDASKETLAHSFTLERPEKMRWMLFCKRPHREALNKKRHLQEKLLGRIRSRTCGAQAVAYALIAWHAMHGQRLIETCLMRTSSRFDNRPQDYRAAIGRFDDEGMELLDIWDQQHFGSLGIAHERLPDLEF